ncbi:hypothetical protein, partial [Cupriavidus yeoncheonensis]
APALPFASLRQQQRNEIMQNFLRFVNQVSNLFCFGPPRQLRAAEPPGPPRNPCQPCLAAPRCVARGRIVRQPAGLGKRFLRTL